MDAVRNGARRPFSAQLVSLVVDTTAGSLSAVLALSYAVGYGAMIFSAGLERWVHIGMPTALVSCVLIALVVTLSSSVPFMIGGPDSNAAALLAGLALAVNGDVRAAGGTDTTVLATVLVLLAVASLVTGALLYALAHWRRGNAIQYIPFPVVGGFLAGSAYLILAGAFRVLTGAPMTLHTLPLLAQLSWLQTVPALLVGVGLLYARRYSQRVSLVPAILVSGVVVFYAGMRVSGVTLESARQHGLMFGAQSIGDMRLPFTALRDASLSPIFSHATEIAAVAAVIAMTVLLNATSIGVTTSRDVDFNRELRTAGIANLLAGLMGGIAGCQSLSRTMVNWRAGSATRRAGLIAAVLCVVVIGGFPDVLALFPKSVMVGLQFYLGASVLIEWLYYAYWRLPWHDYLLIPAIMLIIATRGIVAGVVLGVVAACVLFVVRYGRVNCIRAEFNGGGRRSRVERTIEQNRLLDQQALHLYGISLQGFLFFGTAYSILTHIRTRIETSTSQKARETSAVRYVVVDFSQVHGVDASSTASFVRLRQACAREGAQLVMTGLPTALQSWFQKGGILAEGPREFPTLDTGLEWIEERMLADLHATTPPVGNAMSPLLPAGLNGLLPHMQSVRLSAGEYLFRQNDPGDAVYFVGTGRVTVALKLGGGGSIRLRSFGAGTVIGEMSMYTGARRSADVIAEAPTLVLRLPLATLKRIEADDPALASRFHAFVVRVLAARLAVANEHIRTA